MSNTYQWAVSNSAGSFGTAANWIDETTGTTGVSAPGADDTADLVGAGTITGAGTVSALNVENTTSNGFTLTDASITATSVAVDGSLNLYDGEMSASSFTIGSASASASVQMDQETLSAIGSALDLTVSSSVQDGTATLAEAVGGLIASEIDLGSGTAVIGTGTGQAGSLIVGGLLTGGTGSVLDIGQDGGTGGAYLAGTISTSGSIIIGDGGLGSLNAEGGEIDAGSGSGTALVLGTGGDQGEGFVNLVGADVTLDGLAIVGASSAGSFGAIQGSLTTADGLLLGSDHAGGILSLGSSEVWVDTGDVVVSGSGSLILDGALSQGAAASIDGNLLIGTGTTAGSVTIEGEALTVTGSTTVGALSNGSSGSILVEQGGTLDCAGATLTLIQGAESTALSVEGAGSAVDAGELIVDNGFTAGAGFIEGATGTFGTSLSGTAMDLQGGLYISSADVTATGAVDVTGMQFGPEVVLAGTLAITASGPALSISDFGTVTTQAGALLTATGGIVVDGMLEVGGGTVDAGGNLDVGVSGPGELVMYSGHVGQVDIDGALNIGSATGTGHVSGAGVVEITRSGTLPSGLQGIGARSLAITGADSLLSTGDLIVGSGTGASGVSMAGGTISASGSIMVANRSLLHGSGTLEAANIVDMGHIQVVGGTMSCLGSITGDGLLRVQGGGDMILGQGEAAGVGLVFGSFGTFTAATIASIAGTLSGWQHGDAIDFTGEAIASDHFANHTLSLYDANGNLLGTEQFAGALTSNSFSLSADHGSGTVLSYHR